jgi:RecA/RadA recombinase
MTTKKITKADEKRAEARKKLGEFLKKTSKDLGVTIASDLATGREGRNEAIPTDSMCFDLITGGGFPRHRWTVLSGLSGGGKTTLMQSGMANQLKAGGLAHYADFEGACDGTWVKNSTGVDLSKYENLDKKSEQTFYPLFDFTSGDDFFRYMNRVIEQTCELGLDDLPGTTNLFCLDSIPSLAPEDLIEDDGSGSKPYIALMLSKWIPMVRARLKKSNSAMIAINQIRQKIRLKFPQENPDYEPGGNTPVFLADVRVRIDQVKAKHIDGKKDHSLLHESIATPKANGLWVEVNPDGSNDRYVYRKIHTIKNRVFPPFRSSWMRICTSKGGGDGTGIDKVFDTINFYEELGLLTFDSRDIVFKGKTYKYWDLKKQIETATDIRDEALELLDTGKAFDLYAARLSGMGEDLGKPSGEDEE